MATSSVNRFWPGYRLTTPLRAVAWLYLPGGALLVVAPIGMVSYGAVAWAAAGLVALGTVCLVAGISLLRGLPWAGAYTSLLAASGLLVG